MATSHTSVVAMRRVAPTVSGCSPGTVTQPLFTRSARPRMKPATRRASRKMTAAVARPGTARRTPSPMSCSRASIHPVTAFAQGRVSGKRPSTYPSQTSSRAASSARDATTRKPRTTARTSGTTSMPRRLSVSVRRSATRCSQAVAMRRPRASNQMARTRMAVAAAASPSDLSSRGRLRWSRQAWSASARRRAARAATSGRFSSASTSASPTAKISRSPTMMADPRSRPRTISRVVTGAPYSSGGRAARRSRALATRSAGSAAA